MTSMSDLFNLVGAPLNNTMWSWGAISDRGDVFLRVWGDEMQTIENNRYVRITNFSKFKGTTNLGWMERLKHIEAIKNGASAFCFLCTAVDPSASPREIKFFDNQRQFVCGGLIEYEGDYWLELVDREPIRPPGAA